MIAGQKYVFIAGGIGITPFRSMVVDLLHGKEKRDIVLFYKVHNDDEILFRDIFRRAEKIGLQTVYVVNKRLQANEIKRQTSDWSSRVYYISGPQGFVAEERDMLEQMGIAQEHIKTDLFTGYEA